EGAPLIETLLAQVPALFLLVTSRRRLGLAGERIQAVPPLPAPPLTAFGGEAFTPEAMLHDASARMLADQAQAARPELQVSAAIVAALAELCARLEGFPLAIELVGAGLRNRTPSEALSNLSRRLDAPEDHRRGVSDRHRSLRAALASHYALLSPA